MCRAMICGLDPACNGCDWQWDRVAGRNDDARSPDLAIARGSCTTRCSLRRDRPARGGLEMRGMTRVPIIGLVAIALVAIGSATPATAAPPQPRYYLSLGDSIAAGQQPVGNFHRGYADQLVRLERRGPNLKLRLVKLGCSGESTATMVAFSRCEYPEGSQLDAAVAFLDTHRGEVAFVTLTIGANDLLLDCNNDGTCAGAQIGANLPHILETLRMHAGADVPIVGMNYYQPNYASWFFDPVGAKDSLFSLLAFNDFLEGLYADAGSPVADVETAFASTDFTHQRWFDGAGRVPLAVYEVCTLTWGCRRPPLGPDIHPNTKGYAVIARAYARALRE
jgi:lysophospholipase L1-like esterase